MSDAGLNTGVANGNMRCTNVPMDYLISVVKFDMVPPCVLEVAMHTGLPIKD